MHRIDAHVDGDRWAGEFEVDALGRWSWTIEAWIDPFASWRDELRRKVEAGEPDLSGELSEGVVLLEQAAERAKGADRKRIAQALTRLRDDGIPGEARHEAALDPELAEAVERHPDRTRSTVMEPRLHVDVDPRARALRRLVRALPALLGRPGGRRDAGPEARRARLRRPLPPAGPPDRPHEPQGPEQHADAGPRRPRLALGDRRRDRRPHGAAPRPRHDRRLRRARRHRPRARHRRRAGLRDPVLRRPPLAARAPGVVQPPPRRHAEVRREPAQEVPGHLQRQLGQRGLARPLGRAARRRALLGRARRADLPRRQPAHEAGRVLGVAHRRAARRFPGHHLPRRGLHPRRDDAPAREGRLQPVLHVLHVEELEMGPRRVRHRARDERHAGVLPAELLRQHARHPHRGAAARRPAEVRQPAGARRDAEPDVRRLLGL